MAATLSKSTITLVEVEVKRPSLPTSLVPAGWGDTVREITSASECREAALALAHAFAADGLSQYLVDSDDMAHMSAEQKWRLHVDIMTYIATAAFLNNGIVTTIGLDYEAVALWMPPGRNIDDWVTIARSGMWRLYFQLSPEGRRRWYAEVLPVLHTTKAEVLGERDDDCYYLLYLGTKPGSRGQGLARKLLEHLHARADAEDRPVYLESSSAANNTYYTKFGYKPRREVTLGGPESVKLSIMVREPQPGCQEKSSAGPTVTVCGVNAQLVRIQAGIMG